MNLVFYGRYSDSGQSEQSIEGQRKVCYEFAERNGYKLIAEYIDRALTGTEADNRPEFQRMIADSAKRQFQGVLVYQLDRFARNRYDSATYKARLKENEKATANLIKAIETGKAVDVISAQIEKRQQEKADLEIQLAKEKMVRPVLTFEEVKFFFEKFKNGDANDHAYRTALIDTFFSKIYLYDSSDVLRL